MAAVQPGQEQRTNPVRPDAKVIALAVSVVQSKPPELTIAEYIRLLGQHVARGRRENSLSSSHRYLDRSSYWRSECERAKAGMKTAKDESIHLKRENQALKAKLDSIHANTKKRKKAEDTDTISVPRSPKKTKQESSSSGIVFGGLDVLADTEFDRTGEIGTRLLGSVFQLLVIVRNRQRAEPPELACHLVRAASAVPGIVQDEIKALITEQATDIDRLRTVLTVSSRTVSSVLVGYDRLCHAQESIAVQGSVVYAVVLMFKDLLLIFELLSGSEVERSVQNEREASTKNDEKSKAKSTTKKPANIKDNPVLGLYSCFLFTIMERLDPKVEGHKALFEGLAYCILNRAGTRLYASVFGHTRAATVVAEIQQSAEADSPLAKSPSLSSRGSSIGQQQIQLEAPYLVQLLQRIMLAAPTFLGAMPGRISKAKEATKASLTIPAKECLQRTLVRCMFGTEGDEHDPFKDCLKMPLPGSVVLPMPKVKEVDVQDWFKEELWRVIGWDILAKEEDW